jgi:endonuclease/exonuclease/phosphatase family metal-dependent hydrolase
LYAVHTVGPVNRLALNQWKAELSWLADRAGSHGSAPLVIAGDFNATWQHRNFRRLLRSGLRDAHTSVGGLALTWPETWWWLPPIMRIDHVLVSRGIAVRAQRVVGNSHSDHAALVTDLGI